MCTSDDQSELHVVRRWKDNSTNFWLKRSVSILIQPRVSAHRLRCTGLNWYNPTSNQHRNNQNTCPNTAWCNYQHLLLHTQISVRLWVIHVGLNHPVGCISMFLSFSKIFICLQTTTTQHIPANRWTILIAVSFIMQRHAARLEATYRTHTAFTKSLALAKLPEMVFSISPWHHQVRNKAH